jgi:hypothetical protein
VSPEAGDHFEVIVTSEALSVVVAGAREAAGAPEAAGAADEPGWPGAPPPGKPAPLETDTCTLVPVVTSDEVAADCL